jgi:acyl-CoA thioester hydrolase
LACDRKKAKVNNQESKPDYLFPITVGVDDLDEMDHVNNLVYLKWCLKAAGAHSKQVGWSSQRYHESGFGFVIRGHKIKYKIPALLGDEVVVKTWVETMEKVSSIRRYHVLRKSDGKRLVEAETTWVFVNLKTLKLTRIPDEIREAFRAGGK